MLVVENHCTYCCGLKGIRGFREVGTVYYDRISARYVTPKNNQEDADLLDKELTTALSGVLTGAVEISLIRRQLSKERVAVLEKHGFRCVTKIKNPNTNRNVYLFIKEISALRFNYRDFGLEEDNEE